MHCPDDKGFLSHPVLRSRTRGRGYVLAEEKLSEELAEALQQRFLAQPYFDAGSKRRWLAVPPKLATVYVAKLAEEMCTASPGLDDQDRLDSHHRRDREPSRNLGLLRGAPGAGAARRS